MQQAVRVCLEQAHRSLLDGGLAVGACYADAAGEVIAVGRNRAYDPAGGTSVLQRNRLAHAELNALAELPVERDPAPGEVLWSTQQPCSMCDAAAVFTHVPEIRWLSADPWAAGADIDQTRAEDVVRRLGPQDGRIETIASAMFVASTIRLSGGEQHPTVDRYRVTDPEGFTLARAFVSLADRQQPLSEFLA